jgi:proteasome lid subunit RPN8/RPN11
MSDTQTGIFRPKGMHVEPKRLRERPLDTKHPFVVYGSEDRPRLYVSPTVLSGVRLCCRSSAPNETIGLLAGTVYGDADGNYTVVRDFEEAIVDEKEASPASVRINPDGQASVRSRLLGRNPALQIVGWFHSHPRYQPFYSPVDHAEQATYGPDQVGIVVSGLPCEDPFGVYLGPGASRLQRQVELDGLWRDRGPQQSGRRQAIPLPLNRADPLSFEHAKAIASTQPPASVKEREEQIPASSIQRNWGPGEHSRRSVLLWASSFTVLLALCWFMSSLSERVTALEQTRTLPPATIFVKPVAANPAPKAPIQNVQAERTDDGGKKSEMTTAKPTTHANVATAKTRKKRSHPKTPTKQKLVEKVPITSKAREHSKNPEPKQSTETSDSKDKAASKPPPQEPSGKSGVNKKEAGGAPAVKGGD